MNRTIIIGLAFASLLSACENWDVDPEVETGDVQILEVEPNECNLGVALSNIGVPISKVIASGILPKNTRIVKAGDPMTMDYRLDRLTIILDQSNAIESADCV